MFFYFFVQNYKKNKSIIVFLLLFQNISIFSQNLVLVNDFSANFSKNNCFKSLNTLTDKIFIVQHDYNNRRNLSKVNTISNDDKAILNIEFEIVDFCIDTCVVSLRY